jgi:lysophospholipase L1-like esterase
VAYGTSLTSEGAWVNQLQEALADKFPGQAAVLNCGKGAMWSGWGVENLHKRVLKHKPDVVFLEFAVNDAFLPYKTSPAQCRKNLEAMINDILRHHARCEIILMTMNEAVDNPTGPPYRGKHRSNRPNLPDYYQVYRDVAKERKLLLVDHYPRWQALREHDRATFDRYVPDGIHPNSEGCARVITPALVEAIFGKQ